MKIHSYGRISKFDKGSFGLGFWWYEHDHHLGITFILWFLNVRIGENNDKPRKD